MKLRLVAGLAMVAAVIGACVIAEPPSDPIALPTPAPRILRSSAVPQPTSVLASWPATFVVPVQVGDARQTFFAPYFIDYNPVTGEGWINYVTSTPDIGATATVRTLQVQIPEPSNDRCHVVEIIVALDFLSLSTSDGRNAHTPRTGADSITWFYSPGGDLAGCPVIDAGLQPDAAALDSLEGGIP